MYYLFINRIEKKMYEYVITITSFHKKQSEEVIKTIDKKIYI